MNLIKFNQIKLNIFILNENHSHLIINEKKTFARNLVIYVTLCVVRFVLKRRGLQDFVRATVRRSQYARLRGQTVFGWSAIALPGDDNVGADLQLRAQLSGQLSVWLREVSH